MIKEKNLPFAYPTPIMSQAGKMRLLSPLQWEKHQNNHKTHGSGEPTISTC